MFGNTLQVHNFDSEQVVITKQHVENNILLFSSKQLIISFFNIFPGNF